MTTPTIKLYGYTTSPYVRKVSCFLHYKGLPFEFVGVNPLDPESTLAFSGGRQVPVLTVGDNFKRDSSPIGLWLDEMFPEKNLSGTTDAERAAIKAIDTWVSDQFIPGMIFRTMLEDKDQDTFNARARKLATIVSSATPLPEAVIDSWPSVLRGAPFIKELMSPLDMNEPLEAMQMRIFMELVAHLGDGPYLGGLSAPSMADFAVFSQFAFSYDVGLVKKLPISDHPTLGPWFERMRTHLPKNPWCIPDIHLAA